MRNKISKITLCRHMYATLGTVGTVGLVSHVYIHILFRLSGLPLTTHRRGAALKGLASFDPVPCDWAGYTMYVSARSNTISRSSSYKLIHMGNYIRKYLYHSETPNDSPVDTT